MKKYGINIVETFKRTIIVNAESIGEAIQKVEDAVENEEIVLNDRDYNGREIYPANDYWENGEILEDDEYSEGFWHLDK